MAEQKQSQDVASQFSDPEMEAVKRYGAAMGGNPTEFEKAVEEHLENYGKMHEALTGGGALGPSDIDQDQAKQSQAQAQNVAKEQAAQASQAQSAQTPTPPPEAPSGPVGVSTPFPAQKGQQEAPSGQDVEPSVPGVQSPASQIQPPPAPDQAQQGD